MLPLQFTVSLYLESPLSFSVKIKISAGATFSIEGVESYDNCLSCCKKKGNNQHVLMIYLYFMSVV